MTRFRLVVLLLLGVVVLSASFAREKLGDNEASIHVLDVGQGNSILLRVGSADILIDGGPNQSVLRRLGEVRPSWDRKIEVVILTHPHDDHLRGLIDVLQRYEVDLVLMPDLEHESKSFQLFNELLREQKVEVRYAIAGQRITIDDVVLSIIAPDEVALDIGSRNINNGSVVVHANIYGHRTLFTGDIETAVERHLIRTVPSSLLRTDIMQAPHHGSNTSSSMSFIEAVSPEIVFASVGAENRYGHPSYEIMERYDTFGVQLFRTDTSGTITFTFPRNSHHIKIRCDLGC